MQNIPKALFDQWQHTWVFNSNNKKRTGVYGTIIAIAKSKISPNILRLSFQKKNKINCNQK